ncbi:universal stress protein [Psychroserpens damuponensis]|uniref:universal stress protein n=1 Tax=Psychroserpens damuponensis TaxID=943936 RepID=UPI00058F738C|nr:universal stress protein [Psychroserpens damuponensis]
MKTILIPTDFSETSNQTIDYVIELFKNDHCEFYFLHTYAFDISGFNAIEMLQADEDWFEKPKQASIKQLGQLVERCTITYNNTKHEFNVISEYAKLVDSIKTHIEKLNIDLMILSSNGEKSMSTNNQNILAQIRTCPILIVPPQSSICNGLQLTIASNFRQTINTNDIDRFCELLTNTNFKIEILVLDNQNTLSQVVNSNLNVLLEHLKKHIVTPITWQYANSPRELKNYAQSHQNTVMCVVDKKPDVFRKIGLLKSKVISTMMHMRSNTVLTIHQ